MAAIRSAICPDGYGWRPNDSVPPTSSSARSSVSGEGLFPEELVGEFQKLRDKVPAETFEDVKAVVESELGATLDAVFSSFEREPLAAASIAQVHRARLLSGEDVVVKVQRPSVAVLCTKTSR